jgi:hypothetical protein
MPRQVESDHAIIKFVEFMRQLCHKDGISFSPGADQLLEGGLAKVRRRPLNIPIAKLKAIDLSITKLSFVGNGFGDVEACVLGVVLQVWAITRYQHAFDPSEQPANHIFSFNFLQDNNTLESLDLNNNNIGNKGAVALAEALEVLYTCFLANSAFKIHAWRHGCCIFPHVSHTSVVQQPL